VFPRLVPISLLGCSKFHSEGIAEREEISTDHTPSNNGQETLNADQFDAKENAATDAIIMEIPQTKLEEIVTAGSSISPRRKVLLITGLSLMPILWKSREKLLS